MHGLSKMETLSIVTVCAIVVVGFIFVILSYFNVFRDQSLNVDTECPEFHTFE
jgi:hypothetical protein